ncbi:helicase RepA family protein [Pseudomonadales bacterium]|nr:helicase RepA family protein [Pseudomonadales bacterium]
MSKLNDKQNPQEVSLEELIADWDKPFHFAGRTPAQAPSALKKLKGFSMHGQSTKLKEQILSDEHVMQNLAILGQWTTLYASPNTGKTLLSIWLLIEQIQKGRLNPSNVFYVNADDNFRGLVEKLTIFENHGIQCISPNHNDFKVVDICLLMQTLAKNNEASGIVIVLDTLKKFVDLMDKRMGTEFGRFARNFVAAGGTLIALAHTNKHKDSEGKGIYSGTSDIVDDCDCVYVLDQISKSGDALEMTHTIEFSNKKARGDVATTEGFSFVRKIGQTYQELLGSVKRLSAFDVIESKQQSAVEAKLEEDNEIIEAVITTITSSVTTKTEIVKRVVESTGETNARVRKVLKARTGQDYARGHRWQSRTGEHNAQTYTILPRV